ncbi:MAG: caspase family protein [Bacteroidales bacterium]|nr:caspase family protein [Bacteroidales bacterium]
MKLKTICLIACSLLHLNNASAQEFKSEKVFIQLGQKLIDQPLIEEITREARYFGLIIGVNNYADPAISSLENPLKDAQALLDVLTTMYTFEKDNIQFLENPKREDIIYSLDYLSRVVTPDDNLLIFYAGHGFWDEGANIGFWLPSDARKISKADWFRNSTLVDYLKAINTRHTLLITDACFGGSIFKTRKAFEDAPRAIKILYEYPSRKAMTSGSLTEVPDQSSFTKYLLERLEKNRKEYLSSEQLFSSLRLAVINNSDAIPQYGEIRNVGDQGGDFIFIKQ